MALITSISISLFIIAGVAKAIMDTLQFHYPDSIFSKLNPKFWNPDLSWTNKYSDVSKLKLKTLIWNIPYPVFLTDAWHLFQFIFLNSLFLGAFGMIVIDVHSFIGAIAITILNRVAFGTAFYVFYNKFLLH